VDRCGREHVHDDAEHDQGKDGQRRPSPLVQYLDVIEQVHLGFFEDVGARQSPVADRTRLAIDGRDLETAGCRDVCVEHVIAHQKNLSRTTIVSPGCTRSVSLTLISFFSPLTMRMMTMRDVEPRSVTPPASESACRT